MKRQLAITLSFYVLMWCVCCLQLCRHLPIYRLTCQYTEKNNICTSSTRTRRGGSCLKDIYIYKTFLIYRTSMRRAPAKPVRACTLRNCCLVSHVTFEAPRHTSHLTIFTLHTALFTLHPSQSTLHFTLYSEDSTVHTSHCTLRTPNFTLHSPHFTLHIPHFALHSSHPFSLHSSHSKLHTSHSTLHSSRPTLHTALFTPHTSSHLSSSHLIPAQLFSSHLFSYVI